METKDVLGLMLQFGTYTLALITAVVVILTFKNHKK